MMTNSAKQQAQTTEPSTVTTIIICGAPQCLHDFTGWRNFDDGTCGKMVCAKCGLSAMQYSIQQS